MEFTAILVKTTAIETVSGQNGNWTQRTLVFQTIGDKYPREIAVTVRNEMCNKVEKYKKGNLLKVQVDATSRFYEGRYYTELRAWSVKPAYTFAPEEHEEEDGTANASGSGTAAPAPAPEMMLNENGDAVPAPAPQA